MLKSKKIFLPLCLVSIVTIILRTMLIINNTDELGFYIEKTPVLTCLNLTLIIFSLICFIVPMFDKFPEENRSRNNDKLLGITSAIFGGVLMFVGLVDFFVMLQLLWSFDFREIIYLLLHTPNSITKILYLIVSFFTGWMLTMTSMKILNNKPVYNNYGLSVMFLTWTVMRILLFVKINTTIVTIADNLYSVIMMIASMVFLFNVSRILFDENYKKGYKWALFSGFILILFGLLSVVPNYIAWFMNQNAFFSIKDTETILTEMLTLFAIVFICVIIYSKGENVKMFERNESDEIKL